MNTNKIKFLGILAGAVVAATHGEGLHAADLGSTCADCHAPDDMSLRITRPAYIQSMLIRGYEGDIKSGIKATPTEMRSHVCQQCHVEYYFKSESKELTFPWSKWRKDAPARIEYFEDHYAATNLAKIFDQDWTPKDTGASMLEAQHPETELYSSSVHARSGVQCADCHMPYQRDGAKKLQITISKAPF